MPKYQIATWKNYDVGDVRNVSTPDLIKAVERSGKAANQRLRSLEKAGFTGGMYAQAMADLGLPRTRFKESAKNMTGTHRTRFKESAKTMTRAQLLHEYMIIRNFMSAKTSTLSGIRSANKRRYETAVSRGFDGSEEEFYQLVGDYFSENVEKLFSSNVIYDIITGVNAKKKRSVVDDIISKQNLSRGEALLDYQEQIE